MGMETSIYILMVWKELLVDAIEFGVKYYCTEYKIIRYRIEM